MLEKLQWNNKTTLIILRRCTNKVLEREYINQIIKVAKTSHSYLIQTCHATLKEFLWSQGKVLNYYLPMFWSPWGELRDRKRGYGL